MKEIIYIRLESDYPALICGKNPSAPSDSLSLSKSTIFFSSTSTYSNSILKESI